MCRPIEMLNESEIENIHMDFSAECECALSRSINMAAQTVVSSSSEECESNWL